MDDESDSGHSGHGLDLQMLRQALEAMDDPLENNDKDELRDNSDQDSQLDAVHAVESNGWYPFTKKEVSWYRDGH
jgi:hypothetical protein